MKFFTGKYFLLLLLSCAFSGTIIQAHYNQDFNDQCCNENSYECACNPLYCGALDIQLQAGVVPIRWRNRGQINIVNCLAPTSLTNALDIPNFRTFFRTPWTIGGQIGYAWEDNVRVYVEFNYAQAKRKNNVSLTLLNITPAVNIATSNFGKYRYFDFYVGTRYYFDRWCNRVSPFLGAKIGVVSHRRVSGSLTTCDTTLVCPTPICIPSSDCGPNFFSHNRSVSGGANAGLDICFCGNWSFVITAEVVASCGPHSVGNIALGVVDSFNLNFASNLLVGHIETELRFPITAGIRYSF